MARSYNTAGKIRNVRRSNAKMKEDFLDVETQRQAKRLSRQQKRLEKETGIANVIDINTRQRVVRFEDVKELKPLTDTQYDFFEAWEDDQATGYVLYGSAGTGKTFLALYHALLDVLDPEKKDFNKIIIVRSIVQTRDIGFLPGMEEKFAPYETPYDEILYDLTGKSGAYQKLKDMGKIEFVTTSFLRGVTFKNAIVIFDECQNENFHGINSLMTRIGSDCKLIMCGDGVQSDLIKSKNDVSGFRDFIDVSRQMPEFRNFKFTSEDIVRSGFVRSWLMTCEKLGLV